MDPSGPPTASAIPGPRRPATTCADAAAIAVHTWHIEARATELPGDRERNYRLDTSHERFVLKVALAGEGESALHAQVAVLEHLARTDAAVAAPACIPSPAGRVLEPYVDREGRACVVRVLTWLHGTPLPDAEERPSDTLERWGALSGSLRRSLGQFHHPGAVRRTPWDLRGACAEVERRLGQVDPTRPRGLLEDLIGEFRELWQPVLQVMPEQVIHNDLNDHNVVLLEGAAGDGDPVLGVIDFGDLIYSVGIAELAVAGAYGMLDRREPVTCLTRMVAGHLETCPIDPLELEVLFPLARLRLALSVAMSAQQTREEPENAYLRVSQDAAWTALDQLSVVDPARVLDRLRRVAGLPSVSSGASVENRSEGELLRIRKRHFGTTLSLGTSPAVEMVRGRGQFLFDASGKAYLDLVNNVAHVGHTHPRVVEAERRQATRLNTNSRYLHRLRAAYVERLTRTLPNGLDVCWLVCSGTEANELALRLTRAATGRKDVVVLDSGYHGNSSSMVDVSAYKHAGPGGSGPPDWVRVAPTPDPYRGPFRAGPDCAASYTRRVDALLKPSATGSQVAAFIAEALPGCGGQIVPPDGFLAAAFDAARRHGALAVADEVQTGLGRVGTHFWAFVSQGATPDVVTMGKPLGNGHPLAAVAATREVADAFRTGMEYFNSFGANPVSCAVGLAVLEVLEEEGLQANALRVGSFLRKGLEALSTRHAAIGDVRGSGLFLGVDLVADRTTRAPHGALARSVIDSCLREGVLISRDGPHQNVLKIKPPLCITLADAERVLDTLDRVLAQSAGVAPQMEAQGRPPGQE